MAFEDPNKVIVTRELRTIGPTEYVDIGGVDAPNGIAFYSGMPEESFPAVVNPFNAATLFAGVSLSSAALDGGGPAGGAAVATFQAWKETAAFGGHSRAQITADNFVVNIPPATGTFKTNKELTFIGQDWILKATTPLAGTWVDAAGSRFGYTKDVTGRVSVRGFVSGGGAGATVVTLPAGYRPSSNLEFTMRANAVVSAVSVSTAGVLTVTANLPTASASGIYLDCITYPTL